MAEGEGLSKAYEDKLLIDNLTFKIPRGSIVGIVGPNGAGKTTLFKMIVGEVKPDKGTLRLGDTVKVGYVDQARANTNPESLVWEEISDKQDVVRLGNREVSARQYASWFNFTGDSQQKRVKDLSGGERNRMYLAKMLKEGANLLLLDEPTNDLDVNTMRALEEALLEFGGSALIISHDRWFLDRVCTHIMGFEGDSHVEFHTGNYSDYEADLKKRTGQDVLIPKRIKYRRISN